MIVHARLGRRRSIIRLQKESKGQRKCWKSTKALKENVARFCTALVPGEGILLSPSFFSVAGISLRAWRSSASADAVPCKISRSLAVNERDVGMKTNAAKESSMIEIERQASIFLQCGCQSRGRFLSQWISKSCNKILNTVMEKEAVSMLIAAPHWRSWSASACSMSHAPHLRSTPFANWANDIMNRVRRMLVQSRCHNENSLTKAVESIHF